MSTSTRAHGTSSGGGRHHTVAELVARERAAPDEQEPGAESRPATDRLRGDGHVRRNTGDSPGTGGHTTHVTELLRRERGVAAAVPVTLAGHSRTRGARATTVSRAAVLVGLTVAGMVGLQSTAATPLDRSQGTPEALGAAATAPHAHHRAPTTASERVSTNTASASSTPQIELRGAETSLDQPAHQGERPAAGATPTSQEQPDPTAGQANSSESDSHAARSRAAQPQPPKSRQQEPESPGAQPGSSRDTGPSSPDRSRSSPEPQEATTGTTDEERPAAERGGHDEDGGLLAPVLDPVAGTLTGVLDAGTSLLGG